MASRGQSKKVPKKSSKKADNNDARGRMWSEEELGIFLDIWAGQEIQSKLDGTVRNNYAVFGVIATKLTESADTS